MFHVPLQWILKIEAGTLGRCQVHCYINQAFPFLKLTLMLQLMVSETNVPKLKNLKLNCMGCE